MLKYKINVIFFNAGQDKPRTNSMGQIKLALRKAENRSSVARWVS